MFAWKSFVLGVSKNTPKWNYLFWTPFKHQWLNWANDEYEKSGDKSTRRVDSKSQPIDLKPCVLLLHQRSPSKKIIEKNRTLFVHSRISSLCCWLHHLKGSASLHWRWWTRQLRRNMRSSNQIFCCLIGKTVARSSSGTPVARSYWSWCDIGYAVWHQDIDVSAKKQEGPINRHWHNCESICTIFGCGECLNIRRPK